MQKSTYKSIPPKKYKIKQLQLLKKKKKRKQNPKSKFLNFFNFNSHKWNDFY